MLIQQTERLVLREFEKTDAEFIYILLNTPSWLQFIGDRNIRSVADAENYLIISPLKSYKENGFGLWMVETKSGTAIGMCGLIKRAGLEYVDIGFAMLPDYSGKGYGYEAATTVLDHAKNNLHLAPVVAITSPDNLLSIKLLNKIGLRFKKMFTLPGEENQVMLFS